MHFEHPEILYGIFALPLLGALFWWSQWRRRRLLERFGRWSAVARLIETTSGGKQAMKMALLTLCVGSLVVALARPQWGESERKLTRRGIDLMIAIDVSNSMLASDIEAGGGLANTRLARAKEQLRRLVVESRGHRIGILAFAGAAFVQCPLTLDYGLALNILDALEVGIVPFQGTSIGAAINTAVDAFERADQVEDDERPPGPQGERVLLLLTDGEDHDKATMQKAVARASKAGIKIYAIGIGSERGSPITMRDGSIKKDSEDRVVTTRVDYETLSKVALDTGGAVVRGTPTGNLDLREIQKQLDELEQSVQKSATKTVYEERFVPVLALVVILLIWEMFQGDRRAERLEVGSRT
jgi:Ca-activated chloride channel family protein